jgi:hypothetical protein
LTSQLDKPVSAGADAGDGGSVAAAAESAGKRRLTPVAAIARSWLFPGIVASMVLGNQPFAVARWISQGLNWVTIAAGFVVLFPVVRRKTMLAGLAGVIVITKVLRSTAMSGPAEVAYVAAINVLFCIAGAVVAYRKPALLYRQVMAIALVNMVFMVLQVVGVGAWTQLLTTHGEGNLTVPVRTLFVSGADLQYQLVQGRPAGLSYSNIILALFICFAAVLHLSRTKGRMWWGTAVISVMVVFSMSKFVLVVCPLVAVWLMVTGRRPQRALAARALAGIVVTLAVYCYVFPGLASTNLSVQTIKTSFYLRLNDIAGTLPHGSVIKERSKSFLEGTPRASWVEEGSFVSGYSQIIAKFPVVMPIIVVAILGNLVGLRALRRRSPEQGSRALLVGCIVAAYPFTFPAWGVQMYWFMAGLALVPLFRFLWPEFRQEHAHRSPGAG